MKRIVALPLSLMTVLIISLLFYNPFFSSGTTSSDFWTHKAPIVSARYALGAVAVDGIIYAVGGYNSSLALVGNNEMYDPASDAWTSMARMPTPRAQFGIAIWQDKIFVVGGVTGRTPFFENDALSRSVVTGIVEVYDPATNTWTTKSPMPTARGSLQANNVNNKIYVTGGVDQDSHFVNATEVYDPLTDSWSTMASMPLYQEEAASAVVNQKIFVISDKVQIFDPTANQWSLGTSPPTSIYQGAAGATTGEMAPKQIYVIHGGEGFNQIYNPVNDSWTTGAPMPNLDQNRLSLAVVVINDTIYAIGGSNTNNPGSINVVATNDQYIPVGYGNLTENEPSSTQGILDLVTTGKSAILIIVVCLSVVLPVVALLHYRKKHSTKSMLAVSS